MTPKRLIEFSKIAEHLANKLILGNSVEKVISCFNKIY